MALLVVRRKKVTDGEIHQLQRRMQLAEMLGKTRGWVQAALRELNSGNKQTAVTYLQEALAATEK